MLDIIALIFIAKAIHKLAIQKGLKPGTWKIYLITYWFAAEFIAVAVGLFILNSSDIIGLQFLAWIFAVGSFLIIRSILLNKPNHTPDEDINRIGVDDLRP